MTSKRRCTRKQLLRIVAAMATEFESRAGDGGPTDAAASLAYRRTAAHLRELMSIADGRRASTYWIRDAEPQGTRGRQLVGRRPRSRRSWWRQWLSRPNRRRYVCTESALPSAA